MVRHAEPFRAAVIDAKPEHIVLNQPEYFFVGNSVLAAEDEELLFMFNKLHDILTKQRKGRVGGYDVGLLQQADTLGRAEVAVPFQQGQGVAPVAQQILHVGQVDRAVFVFVRYLGDLDFVGGFGRGAAVVGRRHVAQAHHVEQRQLLPGDRRAVIAGGNQLFETQKVEIQREVLEEVAFIGVIAVAEDHLAAEVRLIVAHFRFNVGQLGIRTRRLC